MPGHQWKNRARITYLGYKVFQAARLCGGDATVLAELLLEGVVDIIMKEILMEFAEVVLSLHTDAKDVQDTSADFVKFAQMLVAKLREDNHRQEMVAIMLGAQETYEMFMAYDTDGSGTISEAEFTDFAHNKLGISRDDASENFKALDKDGNGIISFSEWLCLPPVRDESTFNCVGGHGLARGNVAFPYTPCAWCKRNISKGQKVLECRACHCHACLDCVTKHLVKPYGASAPRISCKRDHRLVWRQTNGPFPTMCNVCGDLTAARAVIFGCRTGGCAVNVCVQCILAPPENITCRGVKLV